MNNSNNNAVNSCCAPLTPNKQHVINDTVMGDEKDVTADLKTIVKELYNQTQQMLSFRACAQIMQVLSILHCDI